jgi:CxxC-x17-CxxC domain-containing protein
VPYEERTLTCKDCGQSFTFSAEDQEFFASKGYSDPLRCPACRQARKAERGEGGSSRGPRQMFPAVCAECGKETQVPFEPRGDRPVYCSDCFSKRSPTRSRY